MGYVVLMNAHLQRRTNQFHSCFLSQSCCQFKTWQHHKLQPQSQHKEYSTFWDPGSLSLWRHSILFKHCINQVSHCSSCESFPSSLWTFTILMLLPGFFSCFGFIESEQMLDQNIIFASFVVCFVLWMRDMYQLVMEAFENFLEPPSLRPNPAPCTCARWVLTYICV